MCFCLVRLTVFFGFQLLKKIFMLFIGFKWNKTLLRFYCEVEQTKIILL
jgi:hypothetical protein